MTGFVHETCVSESVEWYTPPSVFEALAIDFDLDPASPAGGLPWIPARRYFSPEDDGLAHSWQGRVWLNPPYGPGIDEWMRKPAAHGDGIALVFDRSDTRWWHEVVPQATAICFIQRRLRFVRLDETESGSAGAPSVLIAFGLTCALALCNSGLGYTMLNPQVRS